MGKWAERRAPHFGVRGVLRRVSIDVTQNQMKKKKKCFTITCPAKCDVKFTGRRSPRPPTTKYDGTQNTSCLRVESTANPVACVSGGRRQEAQWRRWKRVV